MRIFLDANILFSASKSHGAVSKLVHLLQKAGHECCADGFVAEEARRNLAAKCPESLPEFVGLLSRIHLAKALSARGVLDDSVVLAEKDRPVLAAAINLRCAALVTGDRMHFGHLYGKTIRGVAIHSPRSLAETLLK